MARIKAFMFDVGYDAETLGIKGAAKKHGITVDEVKVCVMFVAAFQGDSWEEFEAEGYWKDTPEDDLDPPDVLH